MRFYPIIAYPWILLFLLASTAALYLLHRFSQLQPMRLRNRLTLLRGFALALFIGALLNPGYIVTENDATRSAFVYLIDESASMGTTDMPQGASRASHAHKIAKKLLEQKYPTIRKYVYTFNHLATPADSHGNLPQESPDGATRLADAIATAERDIGDEAIGAYIVITDGLDNSGFKGHPKGIPVHAIRVGTDLSDAPDLRIDDISPALSLAPGEQWDIEIPLTLSRSAPATQATLTITADGVEKLQKTQSLSPDQTLTVPFSTAFKTPGLHQIALDVTEMSNEISTVNNHRKYLVEVRDDDIAPLIYFPVLNNSYRPLTRLFTRTGRKFAAICRMRNQNYLVQGNSPLASTLRSFPNEQEVLGKADLLILGSAIAEDYSDEELKHIEQYVNQGGNLIFMGGPEAFANSGKNLFTALLPAISATGDFNSDTLSVNTASSQRFRSLARFQPTIRGLNQPGTIKAGATVLLTAGKAHLPLVLAMPYGRGQVLAILSNSLHLAGEPANECYQAFWENLLAYISSNLTSRLTVNAPLVLADNAPLTLHANAPHATSIEAELSSDGLSPSLTLPLARKGNDFSATFTKLPTGQHTLRITAQLEDMPSITRYLPCFVNCSPFENGSMKATDENLLRFTNNTRIYPYDDLEPLHTELERLATASRTERIFRIAYEKPYYALLILLVLMAEWLLRRKNGLF